MSDQDKVRVPGSPEGAGTPATSESEPISRGKRNALKAGWVLPVIAVLSLPKNSYAVVGS